jgi:hypothetical protein
VCSERPQNHSASVFLRNSKQLTGFGLLQLQTQIHDVLICDRHKNRAYVNNIHSLQELKENIQREMDNISRQELCRMLRNVFRTARSA